MDINYTLNNTHKQRTDIEQAIYIYHSNKDICHVRRQ